MQFLDGIAFAIRSPMDRLGMILSIAYQINTSYCAVTDATTTAATVPTTDAAMLKKGIQFEHAA